MSHTSLLSAPPASFQVSQQPGRKRRWLVWRCWRYNPHLPLYLVYTSVWESLISLMVSTTFSSRILFSVSYLSVRLSRLAIASANWRETTKLETNQPDTSIRDNNIHTCCSRFLLALFSVSWFFFFLSNSVRTSLFSRSDLDLCREGLESSVTLLLCYMHINYQTTPHLSRACSFSLILSSNSWIISLFSISEVSLIASNSLSFSCNSLVTCVEHS